MINRRNALKTLASVPLGALGFDPLAGASGAAGPEGQSPRPDTSRLDDRKERKMIKKTPTTLAVLGIMPVLLLAAFFFVACAADAPPAEPETEATQSPNCPVCGMYADMTPDWQASMEYQDGSVLHFDVPEHLLAFYHNPAGYQVTDHQKNLDHLTEMTVTDYQSKSATDARQAVYLIDSEVKSPMGNGAVPFQSQPAAEQFQAQHGGRMLSFRELTPEIVQEIQ